MDKHTCARTHAHRIRVSRFTFSRSGRRARVRLYEPKQRSCERQEYTSLKVPPGSKKAKNSSVDMRPATRTGLSANYVILSATPVSVSVPFSVAPVAVCTKRKSAACTPFRTLAITYMSVATICSIIFISPFSTLFLLLYFLSSSWMDAKISSAASRSRQ